VGSTPEEREGLLAATQAATFDPAVIVADLAPGEATDASTVAWWRMLFQSSASPAESYDQISAMGPVDIRRLLGSVQARVLVLHRTGDRMADVRASRYLAERLPNARLVELPGEDHFPLFGDQEPVVALTQEFLTGALPVVDPDPVLFTDLVDSTSRAAALGDRRWHRLLEHFQLQRPIHSHGQQDMAVAGLGVSGGVGQRLGDDPVGRHLHRRG
jgi:hypothetical protein